jgi:hypothetical protein
VVGTDLRRHALRRGARRHSSIGEMDWHQHAEEDELMWVPTRSIEEQLA